MPYVFNPLTGNFDDTVPLQGGKVPAEYLPSYVDDVEEYANFAALPATGSAGKIYVTLNDNNLYRWSGSQYTIVGTQPPVTSVNGETGAVLLDVRDLEDYNLRLAPNPTSGRWNTVTFGGLPAAGQFRPITSTRVFVAFVDSLGNNLAATFTSAFANYSASVPVWLSNNGVTWVSRTSQFSIVDTNNNYLDLQITNAFDGLANFTAPFFLSTTDPSAGPATLPLANKNVLSYNSSTTKWEPTPLNLTYVSDVDVTTTAPTNNQGLLWNGTKWVPGNVVRPTDSINVLADVDTATTAPTNGQALVWNGTNWVPTEVVQPTEGIAALNDVDTVTTPPVEGKLLKYKGSSSKWEPNDLSIKELTDVDINAEHVEPLADGRALIYANGKWQAGPIIGGYSYSTGNDPLASFVRFGSSYNTNLLDESGYFNQTTSVLITTVTGSMPISSGAARFGTGGIDATWNSWIRYTSTTNPNAFALGTQDFCVEGWFDDNRGFGARGLFTLGNTLSLTLNASNTLTVSGVGGAANQAFPSGFVHIALTRENGTMRLFQNGILVLSGTNTTNYSTSDFRVGYSNPVSPYFWQGFIDDVRLTIGAARYTTNFTPPSGAILGDTIAASYNINNLSDVDTATVTPTTNQGLTWNGTNWVPSTVVRSATTGITGATAVTNCVQLSQANYDAIVTKDPNTLYVIV